MHIYVIKLILLSLSSAFLKYISQLKEFIKNNITNNYKLSSILNYQKHNK